MDRLQKREATFRPTKKMSKMLDEADDDYAPPGSGAHEEHAHDRQPEARNDDTMDDEDDEEQDDLEEDEWSALEARVFGERGGSSAVCKSAQLAARFESLVSLEPLRNTSLSQAAGNELGKTERKMQQVRGRRRA